MVAFTGYHSNVASAAALPADSPRRNLVVSKGGEAVNREYQR